MLLLICLMTVMFGTTALATNNNPFTNVNVFSTESKTNSTVVHSGAQKNQNPADTKYYITLTLNQWSGQNLHFQSFKYQTTTTISSTATATGTGSGKGNYNSGKNSYDRYDLRARADIQPGESAKVGKISGRWDP